jgi:hypothetical protein
VPELVGALDAEYAQLPASPERPVALQEALGAHHPLRALASHRLPSSRELSAATIRLPSVGLRFAVSTIARSTAPATGRGPGSVRRFGVW